MRRCINNACHIINQFPTSRCSVSATTLQLVSFEYLIPYRNPLMSLLFTQRPPRFEPKLKHHVLVHDNTFLERIAKSETFKIVRYEEKLRQKGKLKYQGELEEFWKIAREDPLQLEEMLERENIGQ